MKIQQYIYFLREKKVSQSTPTTGSNMFVPNKQNASSRKHTGPPNTDAVHWLPPGVGFTQKPFSVSENGPFENFLRSNSIFI